MKNYIMLFVMAFITSIPTNSQTIQYRYVYSVTPDGIKYDKWANDAIKNYMHYYTYTNNKTVCYASDSKGNVLRGLLGDLLIYDYYNEENGIYIYRFRSNKNITIRISKDYKRINVDYLPRDEIEVYEMVANSARKPFY